MRQFSRAVLLWMLLQTLMSPAAIARDAVPAEPVAVSASGAASATNVNADSVTPKINDMKIDIATACAIPTYPEAALRYGMQGDTVLKLMIDESGKIKAFQLVRSSGWKMLDLTVMNAIIGCQILPEGRWVPSETYTAYRWKFDQGYTSPAVLEAKTCKSSDKLRIADDRDNKNKDAGIVVGIYTSETGKVLDAKVQWGSDDEQLDQESLRIARSCEFMPAERSGKRIRNAGSLRFVAK